MTMLPTDPSVCPICGFNGVGAGETCTVCGQWTRASLAPVVGTATVVTLPAIEDRRYPWPGEDCFVVTRLKDCATIRRGKVYSLTCEHDEDRVFTVQWFEHGSDDPQYEEALLDDVYATLEEAMEAAKK